uniref:Nucleolar protein 8 n=1 Tax=Strigamia maritima TaxID=126957 RepID=T1J661_STRMM
MPRVKMVIPKFEKHKADNEKRLEAIDKQQENLQKHKQVLNNALTQSLNKISTGKKKIYYSSTDSESEDDSCANLEKKFSKKSKKLAEKKAGNTEIESTKEEKNRNLNESCVKSLKKSSKKSKKLAEKETGSVKVESSKEERDKNLAILDKIVGPLKQTTKRKSKQFNLPAKMIRYNPSNIEHKVYEIDTTVPSETEPQDVPEVSKEKYFELSNSLIADLKDGATKKGSFSLLKKLKGDDDEDDEPSIEESQIYFPPPEHEEEFIPETTKNYHQNTKETCTSSQPTKTAESTNSFFLSLDDSRLAKGSQFFCRKESKEDTHKLWTEKRAAVNKQFKVHMKQAKHRHNPMERL